MADAQQVVVLCVFGHFSSFRKKDTRKQGYKGSNFSGFLTPPLPPATAAAKPLGEG
jgi:hypothetical protein